MISTKKLTKTVEVRPGIFFDIPQKQVGFSLLRRRFYQLLLILFSPRYCAHRDVIQDTAHRYAQPKEVEYYKAIALSGLYPIEFHSFNKAKEVCPKMQTILVLGCGTGREAFALEKLGFTVTAFDFCGPMLDAACELGQQINSSVQFMTDRPTGSFDMVFFTYGMSNHLLSRQARVELLHFWSQRISKSGILLFGGYYRKIHLFDRFYFASWLLRLRWRFKKNVEAGTTLISHFGFHNDEAIPLPFHFYQSREEIEDEIRSIGMHPIKIDVTSQFQYLAEGPFLDSHLLAIHGDRA